MPTKSRLGGGGGVLAAPGVCVRVPFALEAAGGGPWGEAGENGSEGVPGGTAGERRVQGGHRGAAEAPEGDAEAAFTAYVRERRASLYATAYHLTGDRFEAEDLVRACVRS